MQTGKGERKRENERITDIRNLENRYFTGIERRVHGCILLPVQGRSFCQCPDRKHAPFRCAFIFRRMAGSFTLCFSGAGLCGRNSHRRVCSFRNERPDPDSLEADYGVDGSHYPCSGGVDSPEPESSCQCTDFVCLWDAGRELS